MSSSAKSQLLTHAIAQLKKKYPLPAEPPSRPVLDEVLFAILREEIGSAAAEVAFGRLKQNFFDWNEVRVSTIQEVAETLGELPEAGAKAQRIINVLQEVFDERFSFDLNDISKKGQKQASKQLGRYKGGANDFVVAWATFRALGGHALPADPGAMRVLFRLRIIDDAKPDDPEEVRTELETIAPKVKPFEFAELLTQHAAAVCVAGTPDCPHCVLKGECPTGQELLAKGAVPPAVPKGTPKKK